MGSGSRCCCCCGHRSVWFRCVSNCNCVGAQLCLARRAQQQTYIKLLASKLAQRGKAAVNLVGLPLLPAEVRGLPALTAFAHELLHPCGEFASLQAGLQAAFVDTMQLD